VATHAPLPWDTTPGKDVVTSARTPERTEVRDREREKERKREEEKERQREREDMNRKKPTKTTFITNQTTSHPNSSKF
jgi:hypothetical protein